MPISEVYNEDNIKVMARYPDKFFQLAIVDPPYGINAFQGTNRASRRMFAGKKDNWDASIPGPEYFNELRRVSKEQIIWGGNYFLENLGSCRGFIIWDKLNPDRCFADCEFAWNSIDGVARIIKLRPQSENAKDGGKIHPTQKPVQLYKWIIANYAKQGGAILDTHLGSQSSRVAAWQMGFDFYGCEIDKDYFNTGNARFEEQRKIASLFTPENTPLSQSNLFQ